MGPRPRQPSQRRPDRERWRLRQCALILRRRLGNAGNGQSDNGTSPLAGLGLTAKLSDLIDLQARYRYMWDLGDDQKTWKTDMSVATLELVMHPNRTTYVAPAPAPAPQGEIVNILLKIKNSFLPTKQILIGL